MSLGGPRVFAVESANLKTESGVVGYRRSGVGARLYRRLVVRNRIQEGISTALWFRALAKSGWILTG